MCTYLHHILTENTYLAISHMVMYRYGTAQQQLDTRMRVNGEKCVGKLTEYKPNPCGCPSRFKSVTARVNNYI